MNQIRQIKSVNVSKSLNVIRAFVDGIRGHKEDLLVSVAYRKGRAFCKYNSQLKIIYRTEEEDLKEEGLGDFRAFCVDPQGNMIIAGSKGEKISLFYLDKKGEIQKKINIPNFPFLFSMACNPEGQIFLHSPLKEYPIYTIDEKGNLKGFGSFPKNAKDTVTKVAQMYAHKKEVYLLFENKPPKIQKYTTKGKLLFEKQISAESKLTTQILDFCIHPISEEIFILNNTPQERIVDIYSPQGEKRNSLALPPHTRRLWINAKGEIYASKTIFGYIWILLSPGIYGAITTIDVFKSS